MPKCRGCEVSGKTCEGYSFERKSEDKYWDVCFCSHTAQVHPENFKSATKVATAEPISVKAPTKKVAVSKVETTLTPAVARAKLKAAGHQVGQRGRLSPAQLALAATL